MNPDLRDDEFRAEVRDWITRAAPPGLEEVFDWRAPRIVGHRDARRSEAMRHPLMQEWDRISLEARMVCPSWPAEYGGRGWNRRQRAIFEAELHRAGIPRVDRELGESLVGPTVIAWGTDDQKHRFLPPIISGEHVYCQGFSEPDYGSDLAGLQTRGVVDGDDLVITGQKVWTTHALDANMIIILCRTDPAATRHRGITFVIAPFGPGNGVEIQPIRQISGPAEFAQDFFEGMRAPLANVIGGLGNGWQVTMTTLSVERDFNLPTLALENTKEFWDVVATARRTGRVDEVGRQLLARAYTTVSIMRYLSERILADPEGRRTEAAVSITKLLWSEYHRGVTTTALGFEGADALVRPDGEGYPTTYWQDAFLGTQAETIFAGTSDIQRNLIGERVLGLPR